MKDYSLPYLTAKKLLEAYYMACINQDKGLAYQIANDLVDQWSNEDMMVFNTTEIIFPLISG